MVKAVKLGYDEKGRQVDVKPAHLVVTGVTQLSGKTTTLESLIKRSGLKAIVFKTKIGEKSFLQGTIIPPFFKDRSDWQFIQGLVEATIKERLRSFERAKIIQIAKQTGGHSLVEFKKKVDERLGEKLNGFEKDILTNLQAYLEIVLPKLQTINFSNELELTEGLNIIDLERFSRDAEVQSLIIRSVAEEVLNVHKGVVLVIPEAWKFLPQNRGNPCKWVIEEFVRQGASNNNFIWIDSQDMAGVDKTPLKQVSAWILGYQSEINEVKHTLDQIPLPSSQKPKADEVMSLELGQFILATREQTVKVYVQPWWLDDERAVKVATGKLLISEIDAPERLAPFKIAVRKEVASEKPGIDLKETTRNFQRELSEMAAGFFNKIGELQEQINKLHADIYALKSEKSVEVNEDVIIRKVLQKIPSSGAVNKEALLQEILTRIPGGGGGTYVVSPLEKIRKDFLEKAKRKILEDVAQLDARDKEILKFMESQDKGVTTTQVLDKCLHLSTGGANRKTVTNAFSKLDSLTLARYDPNHGTCFKSLNSRIASLLKEHGATEQEIGQVYNHVLAELV